MKSYGDLDFNNNQMQRMALQEELTFPNPPVVGRIAYVGKRVWICVEVVSNVPAWVPLTSMNNTAIHDQETASATWTVVHNLNTGSPLVQVYDTTGNMLIPGEITPTDNNTVSISFGSPETGRVVVMFGDTTVYPVA
jgi:hypothetical protein